MQLGTFSISDVGTDPITGAPQTEQNRLKAMVELAVHAEAVGFDVFAASEHRNPIFVRLSTGLGAKPWGKRGVGSKETGQARRDTGPDLEF
jgi:alkanesulfonate monooxygenase SsuD/methylene tetrahydromethanopterin reductase-like flavin-dependent oxidoreductase (luciferase family)